MCEVDGIICSGNGWCRDGQCLCYPEFGGIDCAEHAAAPAQLPMKCALDCVHTCLAKCAHSRSPSVGGTGSCYADCTRPCLPKCVDKSKTSASVALLAAAAEAAAKSGRHMPLPKPAAVHAAHTAVPVEALTSELDTSGL